MSAKRPHEESLDFEDVLDRLFNGGEVSCQFRKRQLARRGRGRRRWGHLSQRLPPTQPTSPKYKARFGLSRIPPPQGGNGEEEDAHGVAVTASEADEEEDRPRFRDVEPLVRDHVVPYLAPHEMLRLLRCNKSLRSCLGGPREVRNAVLESLFAYLRISEECASNVASNIPGGWRAFSPVLVGMCEDMARTYGHLEPDPAHRAIVAEQACFARGGGGRGSDHGLGRLARHEIEEHERALRARVLLPPEWSEDEGTDNEEDGGNGHEADNPLSISRLKNVESGRVCWGDPDHCLVRGDEGLGEWLERNQEWMTKHASDAPNEQYKLRLEGGLHPLIWVMCRPEMYIEYAMEVGPNREQDTTSFSSFYDSMRGNDCPTDVKTREERTETFFLCFNHGGSHTESRTSFVEFLVKNAFPAEASLDPSPTKCMAIWCKRHSLEPFASMTVDWAAVFRDDDPFLVDALTLPDFGPAHIEKYKEHGPTI